MLYKTLTKFEAHECWSKAKTREMAVFYYRQMEFLENSEAYEVNGHTLALYNFSKNPLFNKFYTVIFDDELGMVLAEDCTKVLMRQLVRDSGVTYVHTRSIERDLGIKSHHALCLGNRAFLALQSYQKQSADWVALHNCQDFDCQQAVPVFVMHDLQFSFAVSSGHTHRILRDALATARVMRNQMNDLADNFGYQALEQNSILTKPEYQPGFLAPLSYTSYLQQHRQAQLEEVSRFVQFLGREFEIMLDEAEFELFYNRVKAQRFNW